MLLAITRDISPRFNECEITHIDRSPIDVNVARAQHHDYVQALKELGCAVLELPAEAHLPDSVFVEDTAVVLPDVALITRPGADSRKPETESITHALRPYRELVFIESPATVDGGDVLVIGKNIYVGMSTRSNQAAVDQMDNLLGKYGYKVQSAELHDCLHLKTAVTRVDDKTLLINRRWVDIENFEGYRLIEVDELSHSLETVYRLAMRLSSLLSFRKQAQNLKLMDTSSNLSLSMNSQRRRAR